MSVRVILFLLTCAFPGGNLFGALLTGDVTDVDTHEPVREVRIYNVHSGTTAWSDSTGIFSIQGEAGELIEFHKDGYKTARFRIPPGQLPTYFKIMIQKGPLPLEDWLASEEPRDYRTDSMTYDALYRHLLSYPKLTGLDMIRHPFSAMSKRNRQIWAFQEEYALFEQQKYVDYTFNEKIVENLTGLRGDSLRLYLRRFRPSYYQLRDMSAYNLYKYIKESVYYYRTGIRPDYRPSIQRSTH